MQGPSGRHKLYCPRRKYKTITGSSSQNLSQPKKPLSPGRGVWGEVSLTPPAKRKLPSAKGVQLTAKGVRATATGVRLTAKGVRLTAKGVQLTAKGV